MSEEKETSLEQMFRRIDEMPRWKKWYYKIRRGYNKVTYFPKDIKHFIQRGRRGYSDSDVWGLDWYLASWMPQAMKDLKEGSMGYFMCGKECGFGDVVTEEDGIKHHEEVLDKIGRGFQAFLDADELDITELGKEEWLKQHEALTKETEEGMRLMGIHFGGLWN